MKGQEIYLILHNIRSAYNVGSIFRTADAAGVKKVYLGGYTPTPTDNKVKKTALGAEKTVPWEYYKQTWRLLEKLEKEGVQIVALEQTKKSTDYRKFKPRFPLALVVGNEVSGLNKKILSYTDKIIEIPMYGKKESLNVAVAMGIAVYKFRERTYLTCDGENKMPEQILGRPPGGLIK
jgi:tRNA G18 (ribose-2'-O)-methylase SpoU